MGSGGWRQGAEPDGPRVTIHMFPCSAAPLQATGLHRWVVEEFNPSTSPLKTRALAWLGPWQEGGGSTADDSKSSLQQPHARGGPQVEGGEWMPFPGDVAHSLVETLFEALAGGRGVLGIAGNPTTCRRDENGHWSLAAWSRGMLRNWGAVLSVSNCRAGKGVRGWRATVALTGQLPQQRRTPRGAPSLHPHDSCDPNPPAGMVWGSKRRPPGWEPTMGLMQTQHAAWVVLACILQPIPFVLFLQ